MRRSVAQVFDSRSELASLWRRLMGVRGAFVAVSIVSLVAAACSGTPTTVITATTATTATTFLATTTVASAAASTTRTTSTTAAPATTTTLRAPPSAWTPLPGSPLSPRVGHAAVWTGDEVILWGGAEDVSPSAAVASAPDTALSASPVDESPACPVTIPPQPGLVPPQPYPLEPPPLYDAVWYGTPELWTMLDPSGEIWSGLPHLGQKTFWWSQDFAVSVDWKPVPVDPEPEIIVTGKRLDDPDQTLRAGPGTNGQRGDIGWFMLVGVEFPAPGCWELTARYRDTELSYVVWVTG